MRGARAKRWFIAGVLGIVFPVSVLLGSSTKSKPAELSSTRASEAHPFTVFDGTLYKNKPDLSQLGIKPIKIVYEGELWDQGQSRTVLPDQGRVQKIALAATDGVPVVIDIEGWPTSPTIHKVSLAAAHESRQKLATVLRWFHETNPDLPVGLYGIVPIIDYWRAIKDPNTPEYRSWVSDNDLARPLVGSLDALFPSLYTFYSDRQGWLKAAAAQLAEARRLAGGKPVYVFLWPQYHDSNALLGTTYLPADYWRIELDTARQYADGVVIWGGWGENDSPAEWDEQASWWTVTKKFLTQPDVVPPGAPRDLTIQ